MTFHPAILTVLFLASPLASAGEMCVLPTPGMTVSQFVAQQLAASAGARLIPPMPANACHPRAETAFITGQPACQMNYLDAPVPVTAVIAGAAEPDGPIQSVFYMMRGTEKDVGAALAYFNKTYPDATAEYSKNVKGTHYFGATHAWKDGDRYIVLGQHEAGYDPVEISLHLEIGSKQGIELNGTDLNTCK